MAEGTIWTAQTGDETVWERVRAAAAGAWVYAEREEALALCWAGDLPGELAEWPAARVFGPDWEVRWESARAGSRLTFLSEEQSPGQVIRDLDWKKVTVCQATSERFVLLWGEYDANAKMWWTTQIPKPFVYPVKKPKRFVRLRGLDYRLDGVTVATRLCQVAGYDPAAGRGGSSL